MSVGAFRPPPEKGKPISGESIPEAELTEKPDTVLSTLFTTNTNAPVGSVATPNGCWPVAAVDIADKDPLLMLKVDTVPAATFVAKTNLSIGSTVKRNGLLWQDELQDDPGAGSIEVAVSAPVPPLICSETTDSAMWLPTKTCLPSVARPTGDVIPAGLEVGNGDPTAVKLPLLLI